MHPLPELDPQKAAVKTVVIVAKTVVTVSANANAASAAAVTRVPVSDS
jgi:hypothetical protein